MPTSLDITIKFKLNSIKIKIKTSKIFCFIACPLFDYNF